MKDKNKPVRKEHMNLYRVLSLIAIVIATFGMTAVLCAQNHFFIDEWLCLFLLDVVFLMLFFFQLEFERCIGWLVSNPQTSFIRLAFAYFICCILTFAMTFLPELFRPVMLIPILILAVSSNGIAVTVGIFFDVLLSISSGNSFYALLCFCMLTLLASVLAQALRKKEYRVWISVLAFCLNMIIPGISYYMAYKEFNNQIYIYGAINGIVTALCCLFMFRWLWDGAQKEKDNLLVDIVSDDYSEVKALKDFSKVEYEHARKVSDIASRCAKAVGYNEHLCLAGGFYYRMGQWIGDPYVEEGVKKAKSLCFPEKLIKILQEYYGEEQLPSIPESALVHMVDALVIKLEKINDGFEKSEWNHEILINQTLNEYSSSGIYDHCGMSMNQFLKIRQFLTKEELLR